MLTADAERTVSDTEAGNASSLSPAPRARRWWILPALILAVGTACIVGAVVGLAHDRTYRVFYGGVAGMITVFLLWVWFLVLSPAPRAFRGTVLGVTLGAIVLLLALFRHDGHYGDMIPRFVPRWQPSARAKADAYWAETKLAAANGTKTQGTDGAPGTTGSGATSAAAATTEDVPSWPAGPKDWPGFRGARRDGIVRDLDLRRDWDERPPRPVWRHPIGQGWSSFAIVGTHAFTQEQRGPKEVVSCYDAVTGDPLWVHEDVDRFDEQMGGVGPRATPTFHDGRLYALGAMGRLNCLEARTGRRLWQTNILADAGGVANIEWAMSGSPLVVDDLVVVNPGGGNGQGIAAYDRVTGKRRWAFGSEPAGYCAPRLETLAGIRQILVFDGTGLSAHVPETGAQLWRFGPWENQFRINVAQPLVRDGREVLISSGYSMGSAVLEVTRDGDAWSVREKRRDANGFKLKFNDGVEKDGYVYGLDEGILACIEWSTGMRKWKRGRYDYGQILLVGDLIVVQAEDGRVALVEANPEKFVELAVFPAIEGKTWNHPAIADGRLYVRNADEAACYALD